MIDILKEKKSKISRIHAHIIGAHFVCYDGNFMFVVDGIRKYMARC
jgi:hypothetical protein